MSNENNSAFPESIPTVPANTAKVTIKGEEASSTVASSERQDVEHCVDCDKAAKHAYSDATTAGFFYSKCEKHRASPSVSEIAPERLWLPDGFVPRTDGYWWASDHMVSEADIPYARVHQPDVQAADVHQRFTPEGGTTTCGSPAKEKSSFGRWENKTSRPSTLIARHRSSSVLPRCCRYTSLLSLVACAL